MRQLYIGCLGNARMYKAGELGTEKRERERERERPDDSEAHPLDSIQLKWTCGPMGLWAYGHIDGSQARVVVSCMN